MWLLWTLGVESVSDGNDGCCHRGFASAVATEAEGKWVVVFYRHDCPRCEEIIHGDARFFDQVALRGEVMQVALVELPPYSAGTLRFRFRGIPWLVGRISDAKDWYLTTPQEVILDRAMVTKVSNGKI